jgi:hypothetical protein
MAVWIFSLSGFHRVVATKPIRSETDKQTGCQVPTMVLSEARGLSLFRVIREGLGSAVRLGARGTQRLTYQWRLALEPERRLIAVWDRTDSQSTIRPFLGTWAVRTSRPGLRWACSIGECVLPRARRVVRST